MTEKVDELASHVDDALTSVDELENDPGSIKGTAIDKIKDALKKAKGIVDEMEDAED